MDWKKQFNVHTPVFRRLCRIFLLLVLSMFLLILFDGFFHPIRSKPVAVAAKCNSHLCWIHRMLRDEPVGEDGALPPEWTVADLIRETARKQKEKGSASQMEEIFRCPKLRREYLVFPVPASVVFDQSLQQPVPIVMDEPGAHTVHGKQQTHVLYSDGIIKHLTTEEAEELVRKYHPEPLKIKQDETADENGTEDAVRQE